MPDRTQIRVATALVAARWEDATPRSKMHVDFFDIDLDEAIRRLGLPPTAKSVRAVAEKMYEAVFTTRPAGNRPQHGIYDRRLVTMLWYARMRDRHRDRSDGYIFGLSSSALARSWMRSKPWAPWPNRIDMQACLRDGSMKEMAKDLARSGHDKEAGVLLARIRKYEKGK